LSDLRAGRLVTGVVTEHSPFGSSSTPARKPGVALITMLGEPRSPDPVLPAVGPRVEGVFLGYGGRVANLV
jgi:hypothetical protein